jgi:hypothetical protein
MALVNATLTDSAATIFTANSARTFLTASLGLIVLKNHDASARTVTVHACPADEAVADENMLFEISIPAGDTYTFGEKLLLANTDTIKAFASVTSVVTASVSYLDI